MRSARDRSARILGERVRLRAGQRKRQGRLDRSRACRPSPALARPRDALHAARAPDAAPAGWRQQFVIGEALARLAASAPRRRAIWADAALVSAVAEIRASLRWRRARRDPAIPAGSGSRSSAPSTARWTNALLQPFRQPIAPLRPAAAWRARLVQHAVGMHDLPPPVTEFELAGHPARRAERQAALDPIGVGEEEHQQQVAASRPRPGPCTARAKRPCGLRCSVDAHLQHHDLVEGRLGDGRAQAAVEQM